MTRNVTLHFQTDLVLMRVARKQTATAARTFGATESHAGRIEVAVGEALSNAHVHGYGGVPGPVDLEIAYEPRWFTVRIHNRGQAPSFGSEFPDAPDPRTGGGYGLLVIKELMDEAEFERPGPKEGATLRIALQI